MKIGFVFKKNGSTHSKTEKINMNKTPKNIVSKMVNKFNKFLAK
jgi:hypothetical protein